MLKLLCIFFVLTSCGKAENAVDLAEAVDESSSEPLNICGGTIESDSDQVTYLSPLQPGEVCVWTIHLTSRMGFTLNFSSFDVHSQYTDCRDGGIRIYALTNLVPPDELQSYTFCNNDPPAREFFLGYTIAVVVLYVGEGNPSSGSGFELNWSGSSVDPLRTRHISSYSTAPEGLVKYPVVGAYPTSVAATWLLKPTSAQIPTRVDLQLSGVDLEGCTLPGDPCACDALIVYEVGPLGHLSETRRICREQSLIDLYDLEPRFILGFFSDLEDLSGGTGFLATYFPSSGSTDFTDTTTTVQTTTTTPSTTRPTTTTPSTTRPTTTTTTHRPSTTEEYWETTRESDSTSCGEILDAPSGIIQYKLDQFYDTNERCIWTIRNWDYGFISFTLISSGLSSGDIVHVQSFTRKSPPHSMNSRLAVGTPYLVTGNVAVIMFASGPSSQGGRGFTLQYFAISGTGSNVTRSSRDVIIASNDYGYVRHPPSGMYFANELSTFSINQQDFSYWPNSPRRLFLNVAQLETCCDKVAIYRFTHLNGWIYVGLLTSSTYLTYTDSVLFVFFSDGNTQYSGFYIEYFEANFGSSTMNPSSWWDSE